MTNNIQKELISGQISVFTPSPLPQWGLIMVEGSDAAAFLQNQLTNSVLGMTPVQAGQLNQSQNLMKLVGYCNPKGRLLASAWVALFPRESLQEDRYGLFISKDLASSIAKRLSMYVLRSKVKIRDASEEWSISCLVESDEGISKLNVGPNQLALQLPEVLYAGNPYIRTLIAEPLKNNGQADLTHLSFWNFLEVISAIPRIVLATQEQFVPQMINFESVAGVDFKKGCYPGQEIVARSQYRGAIKRRLQLAHIISNLMDRDQFLPGTELFHSSDSEQPAGMVVLSATNPFQDKRVDLQVECKLEALESGELHLGSIDGPILHIDQLPYPLIEI